MTYTELKTNIADICENSFTDAQLALFTEQAEQKIYNAVQIPALRKNVTGRTQAGNQYLTVPVSDFLYTYSLAVIDSNGSFTYLLNKDVNFIREAYPIPATTGLPKHYAYFSQTSFLLGPTPTNIYDVELHYGYYPESIVTALMEAIRFLKGEADVVAMYEKEYLLSISLLKNLGDGRLNEDTYRSGQYKQAVS